MAALTQAQQDEIDAIDAEIALLQAKIQPVQQSAANNETDERSFFGDVKAWVGGKDVDPSIPIYNQGFGTNDLGLGSLSVTESNKANKMHTAIISSFDDKRLKESILKVEPDTLFDVDQFGNLVAGMPMRDKDGQITSYKSFYPNPKGLDAPTALQAGQYIATGGPVAGFVKSLGAPTAGFTGAMTLGAADASLMEAVSSDAADQNFNLAEIPAGMIGGVLGKGVFDVAGITARLAPMLYKNPSMFNLRNGEIATALKELGFDPAEVMTSVRASVDKMVRSGLDPKESIRTAQAASLPVPVKLTSGQVTGSKPQQLFENTAETGAYGEKVSGEMQAFNQQAQENIAQNVPAIQSMMGAPDAAITVKGEGMEAAQSTLVAQRQEAKAEYTSAYKSSEAATAFTNPEYAPEFSQILTNSLKEFRGGVGGAPATFRLLDEAMDQLANGASVQSLFDLRKAMVKQQAAGGVESGAATALKNGLDDVLNQQMERNLLYGNPASIAKGLEAISKFKDFQNVWNSKGILKTLTAREMRDGELSLIVSPKEAANKILGTGIAKTSNKADLARDLLALKKQLPLAQWDEVRQEAFILLAETLQPSAMVEKQASLQFNKAWRNMKKSNNTLTKLLFSKDEIGMIDSLASTSALIAGTTKNTSNTAAASFGVFQRLIASLGSTNAAQMAGRVIGLKVLRNMWGDMRLVPALKGAMSRPQGGPLPPAVGAMATQGEENPIIQGVENTARFTGAMN